MSYAPHPLARRIHDGVMQLLGTALLKTDMCEQLGRLGRPDEIPASLAELRSALEATIVELRVLMAEARNLPTDSGSPKDQAA
ncbi:MAG: histidine kinase [Chloroflexota bacterium]